MKDIPRVGFVCTGENALELSGAICCAGRFMRLFTENGYMNLMNAKYTLDDLPIDPECDCPVCRKHSRAYIHHLFKAGEMLAMRLTVMHNLYFYNNLMERIRNALDEGTFEAFYQEYSQKINKRI